MPRSRKTAIFLTLILLVFARSSRAQLSLKQKEKINRAVESTINGYVQTLSDLIDTDEDIDGRQVMLEDKAHELFVNTEIDLVCTFCEGQKKEKPKAYFVNLMTNYAKNGNAPIKRSYDLETAEYYRLSETGKSKNEVYVRLRISLDWQAKSTRGKSSIKDERLWFIFMINTLSTNYVAKIINTDLGENRNVKELPVLFIAEEIIQDDGEQKTKEYFEDRLIQAKYKLARKNGVEAYRLATEVLRGSKLMDTKWIDDAEKVKRDVRKSIEDNKLADKGDNTSEYLQKKFIEKGKEAMDKGKIRVAESYFSLALNTGNPEYKQTEIQQQLEKISSILKKLAEIDALAKSKKIERAIEEYQNLIKTDPRNTDYISGLAGLYWLNDQKEKATELFTSAKTIDPENEVIYSTEIESLYQKNSELKRIEALASKFFELSETVDPSRRRIRGIQAYAAAWLNKVTQNKAVALDSCNAAITHCPQLAEPYILKSDLVTEVKEKQKILEEALNIIQDGTERNKISKAKAAKGYGDAKSNLLEVIQSDKTDAKALMGIGKLFQENALAVNKTEPTSVKYKGFLDSAIFYLTAAKVNFKNSTSHSNQDVTICALNLVRCHLFRDNDGDVSMAINILEEDQFGEPRFKKQQFTQDAVYAYLKIGNSRKARDLEKQLKGTSLDKLMVFLLQMDFDPNVLNTMNEQDLATLFRNASGAETSFFTPDRIEKDLRSFSKPGLMENKILIKALKAVRRK